MAPRIAKCNVLAPGERGLLDADRLEAALRIAGRVPDGAGWARSVERRRLGWALAAHRFDWLRGRTGPGAIAAQVLAVLTLVASRLAPLASH